MRGRGRGIINPKNLGGVPLAIIGGKFKIRSTMLADLNDDCTLALLKRFSSAQLFAFVSSPDFSNRRLRGCAMVALKDVYAPAPFSLKSSINTEGTYAVYVADATNGKMAVLNHPQLFHLSPLSDFLNNAEIHVASDDPSIEQVWLDVAQSIPFSQLHVLLTYDQWATPLQQVPTMLLMQSFSSVQSLCISVECLFDHHTLGNPVLCFSGGPRYRELEEVMGAINVGLLHKQLRSLQLVSQPAECVSLPLPLYGRLDGLLTLGLARAASLESIDLRGVFVKPSSFFCQKRWWRWEEDKLNVCELLLCEMLANLKANRTLKCVKLRCHIKSISKLQEKLPEDCKIVELNGEPVLSEEILKSMHCSQDKILIVQEKPGVNTEGQAGKLYLHIDCAPPLPI